MCDRASPSPDGSARFGYSPGGGASASKRSKTEIDQVNGLSKSIGHLLMNETFSDVTLIVDGQRFPAHRVIMASRSDYFR
jgi:BTB/POZ domain-containing protein 9